MRAVRARARHEPAAPAGHQIRAREPGPLAVRLEQFRRLVELDPAAAEGRAQLDEAEIADEPVPPAAEPLRARSTPSDQRPEAALAEQPRLDRLDRLGAQTFEIDRAADPDERRGAVGRQAEPAELRRRRARRSPRASARARRRRARSPARSRERAAPRSAGRRPRGGAPAPLSASAAAAGRAGAGSTGRAAGRGGSGGRTRSCPRRARGRSAASSSRSSSGARSTTCPSARCQACPRPPPGSGVSYGRPYVIRWRR